ncbi:MAG: hypothetical protein R3C14_43020 [Caldilineaceae bacterium]
MNTSLLQSEQSRPAKPAKLSGLPVRTGLRGGVCVDVNDEVKAALQTLTDALGGVTTTSTASATPDATTTTNS